MLMGHQRKKEEGEAREFFPGPCCWVTSGWLCPLANASFATGVHPPSIPLSEHLSFGAGC